MAPTGMYWGKDYSSTMMPIRSSVFWRPSFGIREKPSPRTLKPGSPAGYMADPFPTKRNQRIIPTAIGRLHSGINLVRAQEKLDALAASLRLEYAADYPAQARWSISVQPLLESLVGNVRPMLMVLMAAVVVILLIGSVNIANLLLARASARHKEMALRSALGATGTRVTGNF